MTCLCVLHVWNIEQRHNWNFASYKRGKLEICQRFLCPTRVEHETERHINGFCVLQDCNMIMRYIDFLFPTKMDHRTQIYNRFCVLHACNMKLFSEVSKQNFKMNKNRILKVLKFKCNIYCVSLSFL